MSSLLQEKAYQATELLTEFDIDLWLTFVRETSAFADPVLQYIYSGDLTWQSALIFTRKGDRIAIVGRFEAETANNSGAYDHVIPYDESIKPVLIDTIASFDPQKIAINYSENDPVSDGLSLGMYTILQSYFEKTPFFERLISAERLIGALLGRKTIKEINRIRRAIETTEEIYRTTFDAIRVGLSERDISDFMHQQLAQRDIAPAWDLDHCPTVNAGPDSPVGHVAPTDIIVKPGNLIHFDFGVKQDEYCSDIQRVVYVRRSEETSAPAEVQSVFQIVVQAIRESVLAMKPGIVGHEIDRIAREIITGSGFPEFKYATGHQLGRKAHDGGGILGPNWERYGDSPYLHLEAGQVYTVEPGLALPGYGYIGLEENVLVTESGAEFLTTPQTELIVI